MSESNADSAPVTLMKSFANGDHWQNRRLALLGSSVFYAVVIMYCLVRGHDGVLFGDALNMSYIGLMSNMGAYIFGATWEDLSMVKQGMIRSNAPFIQKP